MSQFLTDRAEIKAWLVKMRIKHYTINADLTVDVRDNVNMNDNQLTAIPVQFGKIQQSFNCAGNELTSLAGCPSEVGSHFSCESNNLTSLEHCPRIIGGNFFCMRNKIEHLHYLPSTIDGKFFAVGNAIKSHILGLFLVEHLKLCVLLTEHANELITDIVNRHLKNGRDVFACQQELIEKGFEEYAQL